MASGTSLPPGGCTIVVSITSTTPGTVTNTTGTLSTAGGTAPPASAPITVSAGAASLAKTIAPGYILPGGAATLTITLGSSGAVPLVLVGVTTSTPGTTTNVTSALSAGGYVVPAASAPIATSVPPVEVPVDSPLALLLTAMLVAIAGAACARRRRAR